MSRLLPCLFRHRPGRLGRVISVVAIVSQLAVGAMVLPDDRPANPLAALNALSLLCQTGHSPGDQPAPAHRAPRPALDPLSVTLALPAAIVLPPTMLPAPPAALALRTGPLPPARAPPSPATIAAYPRGPPVLT